MSRIVLALGVCGVGLVAFVVVLLVRRSRPDLDDLDSGPAASVLSYVAAAFGILVGFIIVFLLGEANDARHATGDEATAIGTAFDEAQLFPEAEPQIQHALICYARAVSEREWPELGRGRSASEADDAYRRLIAAYAEVDGPLDRAFQPAAATNSFVQIGSISTARETRIVAAEAGVRPSLVVLLLVASIVLLVLMFVATTPARPIRQAFLLGAAGLFTAGLLMLIVALNNPFHEGFGPVTPELIEDNTARMVALAPDIAERPCRFDAAEG